MTLLTLDAAPPTVETDKTVMISDIVASTEHLEALGPDIWVEHLDRLTRAVTAIARRVDGVVTTFLGDGFMVLFDEPGAAVEAAMRLQCAARILDLPGVRIGLDHGPMAPYRSTWWVGRPAHVAARLSDSCEAGDVLVSDECWRIATTQAALPTGDRHTLLLRGLCEPVLAHAVRPVVPA